MDLKTLLVMEVRTMGWPQVSQCFYVVVFFCTGRLVDHHFDPLAEIRGKREIPTTVVLVHSDD